MQSPTAVHCSEFLHGFPGLALASLYIHAKLALRFSLQFSMCRWNFMYRTASPYKSDLALEFP